MFPGNTALDTREKVSYWIQKLCEEVAERLERDRSAVKSFELRSNYY